VSGWLIFGGCFYAVAILFLAGSFKLASRSNSIDDAARQLAERKECNADACGIRTAHGGVNNRD